jgi:hypothetical protein
MSVTTTRSEPLPITLDDRNEPEPDVTVVRSTDAESWKHHPGSALIVADLFV